LAVVGMFDDVWESTPLIFTGFVICMVTVFMGLSYLGIPFYPDGSMIYFWAIDFVPTLVIDVAVVLRHAYKAMKYD